MTSKQLCRLSKKYVDRKRFLYIIQEQKENSVVFHYFFNKLDAKKFIKNHNIYDIHRLIRDRNGLDGFTWKMHYCDLSR